MKYLSIFIRVALLALGQSLDFHSASEVSLMDMGNQAMYNQNKAQQSSNRVHISWDILYIHCGLIRIGFKHVISFYFVANNPLSYIHSTDNMRGF